MEATIPPEGPQRQMEGDSTREEVLFFRFRAQTLRGRGHLAFPPPPTSLTGAPCHCRVHGRGDPGRDGHSTSPHPGCSVDSLRWGCGSVPAHSDPREQEDSQFNIGADRMYHKMTTSVYAEFVAKTMTFPETLRNAIVACPICAYPDCERK